MWEFSNRHSLEGTGNAATNELTGGKEKWGVDSQRTSRRSSAEKKGSDSNCGRVGTTYPFFARDSRSALGGQQAIDYNSTKSILDMLNGIQIWRSDCPFSEYSLNVYVGHPITGWMSIIVHKNDLVSKPCAGL
ncbi:hypothetical protein TNCV_2826261 [Trichonephila clavipes]|nr:hypothetical protein TNCV_2826261 [Trichonephila clavipes]